MSGLLLSGPYAHIICIISLSKVRTIAIPLSLADISFLPRFQPLQIMHHFLTTTVYTFVPENPQNDLLGLSILLLACNTHQLFSFLFSFHQDSPPHIQCTKSYPKTSKFKLEDYSHSLPIQRLSEYEGYLFSFSHHGDWLENKFSMGSMPLLTPNNRSKSTRPYPVIPNWDQFGSAKQEICSIKKLKRKIRIEVLHKLYPLSLAIL